MSKVWERLAILATLLATPLVIVALALGYRWWVEHVEEGPRFIPRRFSMPTQDPVEQILRTWHAPAPEFVLAFSGQMYGYLQPCGCARPQVGGLERRYELIQRLRQAGWPVLGFDLGDLGRLRQEIKQGIPALPEQSRLKYEIAWKMLHQLQWQVVGVGPEELLFPLEEVMALALNNKPPVLVSTNLDWPEMLEAGAYLQYFMFELSSNPSEQPSAAVGVSEKSASLKTKDGPRLTARRSWRIVCLSVIQESELAKLRADLPHQAELWKRFRPADAALASAWHSLSRSHPDCVILLHHGTSEEARALASRFDWLHVILSRDPTDVASSLAETLPPPSRPALPQTVSFENRLLVRVGHKGKALGLVAVRPDHAPPFPSPGKATQYRLDYRMVELTERFELPSDKTNPVRELMKEYVYQVYERNFLKEWVSHRQVSHPLQLEQPGATFAGVQACSECHRQACQVWSNSKHSQAYAALIKYGQPQTAIQREG
ncbi:MAG: multiheme c-type cytochrome, partial [Gemmatales bacterium]|nr:hypothetical protein [Gemmatales bacterium]MDW8175825.1 multiheme c-type cytochrome [Gemmatales bacterium]